MPCLDEFAEERESVLPHARDRIIVKRLPGVLLADAFEQEIASEKSPLNQNETSLAGS